MTHSFNIFAISQNREHALYTSPFSLKLYTAHISQKLYKSQLLHVANSSILIARNLLACSLNHIFLMEDEAMFPIFMPFHPGQGYTVPSESIQSEAERRSEERRVGKECRSRWSPYH